MASFLRSGSLVLVFGLSLGIANGCSSSSSGGKAGLFRTDGGLDASVSGGANGVSGATGSGGANGGSGNGGASGGSATGGIGGATTGTGGAADGGSTACTTDATCTPSGKRCSPTTGLCVQCLFDNECAPTERCTEGACAAIPTCTSSKDCRANNDGRAICNATTSLCVACAADADCGASQVCAVDTCVDSATCTVASDAAPASGCKSGEVCSPAGKCVGCVADTDCQSGSKCIASTCRIPCASDNACVAGNQLCDTKLGACVDCTKDANCTSLQYCDTGTCKADVCAQGVKSCVSGAVIECTANGSGILAPVPCTGGKACVKSGTSASCEIPRLADGGLPPPATCSDGKKNGDETATDCGGSCKKCGDGTACNVPADCTSDACAASCTGLLCFPGTRNKLCRPASCGDQVKNGAETDVDCGGGTCPRCPVSEVCKANADCEADICTAGKCVAAVCSPGQCAACFLTQSACCKPSGVCGCATTFPFAGPCQ